MAFVSGVSFSTKAFAGRQISVRRGQANVTMMAKSKSIPFLEAPSKLDGSMVGDVGFDPLYLSDTINLDYARSSELKHGRICMLASIGFFVPSFFHLPGAVFSETNPISAIYKVPVQGWFQILAFISAMELATFKATYDGAAPGDYGFDPLGLAKTPEVKAKYAENEIVHCRAAMVGFSGLLMQLLVTGQTPADQLFNLKPLL